MSEKSAKIRKVMDMVMKDTKNDATNFDGKPFTGKNVAEYLGNHGAAISAVARAIKDVLDIIDGEQP